MTVRLATVAALLLGAALAAPVCAVPLHAQDTTATPAPRPAARVARAHRPTRRSLVAEAGAGGGLFSPGPQCVQCREGQEEGAGMLDGHLAVGLLLRPALSFYLSEDAGSDIAFEGSAERYAYRTAFAELASPRARALVLRLGGGYGSTRALFGGLRGSGAVARVGIGLRTPTNAPVVLVAAADEIAGVGGHNRPHAPYAYANQRSPFRARSVHFSLGARGQLPVGH